MNTLIHADIFFYVTTIVVILLAVLVSILIFFLIKISRNVSEIVKKVKKESDNIVEDVSSFREKIKEEGSKVASAGKMMRGFLLGKTIFNAFKAKKTNSKGKRKAEEDREEGE